MSKVIFKLRVFDPHAEDMAAKNRTHVRYIGTRPGVVLNDGATQGKSHGLFGNILGQKAEDFERIRDIQNHVRDMTAAGAVTYRAVISLYEADALEHGYGARKNWEELIRRKMPDIADKLDIPASSLEYIAAVHFERGHPHCHIVFWDKEQGVKDPFVPPPVSNAIRIDLIKHIFGADMKFWQELKNEARAGAVGMVRGDFAEFVDDFNADVSDMSVKDYAAAMERVKRDGDMADFKLAYSHYSGETVYELAAELLRLREKLPKKGRLAMKFMKPEAKAEIYAFLRELLERNDDCKREYEMYLHSAVELAKFYSADPDDHEDARAAASDEIMSRMGNVVLKLIKKLNEADFKFRDEIRREAYRRQMIESLITEIFGVLARAARSAADNVQHTRCYGDLSKQAKKEYAIKFEGDTGYDWER